MLLVHTCLCRLTKHDGLHACRERLHSGIPIDCVSACNQITTTCLTVQKKCMELTGGTFGSEAALADLVVLKSTTRNFCSLQKKKSHLIVDESSNSAGFPEASLACLHFVAVRTQARG